MAHSCEECSSQQVAIAPPAPKGRAVSFHPIADAPISIMRVRRAEILLMEHHVRLRAEFLHCTRSCYEVRRTGGNQSANKYIVISLARQQWATKKQIITQYKSTLGHSMVPEANTEFTRRARPLTTQRRTPLVRAEAHQLYGRRACCRRASACRSESTRVYL